MRLLGITLLCCLAASVGVREPANLNAEQPSDAKQQLLSVEKDWVTAEVKHDEAALRRILDDKFLTSFGPNRPSDKETFIKNLLSGEVDPTESQTLTDQRVIIDLDTAVVVGTDTLRRTKNGAVHELVARYTVIYIHRDGRWVALAEHMVEVPKSK
jgi:hypothetical protein